jgi:D-amino-acid dehydrogenase
MKVIVLGAGVVGVTSAYFLARAGHEVTVLEKNSAAALGCSYANGGQLSYSHVETWAAKNSLLSIAKAAILPGSFLSISDFANKKFLKWAWKFYKNSAPKIAQENSEKLFLLSTHSKKVLEEILNEENDLKFDYKNCGILHFYRSQKKFDAAIKEAEIHSLIGCKSQILNAEECVKKEPTLVKLFDEKKLVGGIFYDMDASGNCFLFAKELEKICREKHGVVFEYNTDIKNILTNYKKITGINSDKGVFSADEYIYALGAAGDKLLRGIKIDSQIYPLKGYSLSIAANHEFIAPQVALTDPENKIVYSRVGNVFRAAGSIEIRGLKNVKNKKNLDFLTKIVRSTFSDFGNFNEVSDWFGFRPFRPNSIPLICKVKKYENLFLNTGHGSLGWTLSAGSGKILANLVNDRKDRNFEFLDEEI